MAPAPTIIATASTVDADDVGSIVALSMLHPEARIWGPPALTLALTDAGVERSSPLPLAVLLEWARGGVLLVVSTGHAAQLGELQSHLGQFARIQCYARSHAGDGDLPRAPMPAAASCTAGLVSLLQSAGMVPSPAGATAMLRGIHSRTSRLTSPDTTPFDRDAAAQCHAWGASVSGQPSAPSRTNVPGRMDSAAISAETLRHALGRGWPAVRDLGSLAVEQGITPWLVGGGVRDLLQGRPVRDADVVVEGDAPALARTAAARLGGRALAHAPFGTAKWTPPDWSDRDEPIDIATSRSEIYAQPAALPTVAPAPLERDLHRRDFTLNAMAVCLHPSRLGAVLDPFQGRRDLEAGVLRVLHDRSFEDDPTRAIRAVRFASRFGLTLDPHTRALLDAAVQIGAFGALSVDRLGAELDRLLQERDPVLALRTLQDWGLLPVFHPSWTLGAPLLDQLARVMQAWQTFVDRGSGSAVPSRTDCAWVMLAGGLQPALRPESAALIPGTKARRARFIAGPEPILAALDALTPNARPAAVAHGLQVLDDVQLVVAQGLAPDHPNADSLEAHLQWWCNRGRHIRSTVDGRWLMQQGHQPSPHFRSALAAAQDAAWNGEHPADQKAAAMGALQAVGADSPGSD